MREDGRLGDDEIQAGERSFARGDSVIAKHNERRLKVTNGSRGTVVDVDVERRSLTLELGDGRKVELDSAYLEHGHLDHGYALTAHAAQGATVDRAFVLGSDDLYREWGYTALTRHREEARFYLVSLGSTERCLPGLEPEQDPLLGDLGEMLGESRQKSLAIDLLSEEPLEHYPTTRIADREAALGHEARQAAAARLAALQCERAELGIFQRGRRAEIDEQIALQVRAIDHWETTLNRATAEAPRPTAEDLSAPRPDVDELRSLLANSSPPESLWEREAWAHELVATADPAVAFDPIPDLELGVPDFDLGP